MVAKYGLLFVAPKEVPSADANCMLVGFPPRARGVVGVVSARAQLELAQAVASSRAAFKGGECHRHHLLRSTHRVHCALPTEFVRVIRQAIERDAPPLPVGGAYNALSLGVQKKPVV